MQTFHRRAALKGIFGSTALTGLVNGGELVGQAKLIQQENAKPGTTDWQLTRVRVNKGK